MRRGSAASVCRSIRDWVSALQRPRTGRAGRWEVTGQAPSKLNADHRRALAEVVEAGPVPAVDDRRALAAQGPGASGS